jgi:hypothetical protein
MIDSILGQSQRQRKNNIFSAIFASSEAGGLDSLTYPHSKAWTISMAEGSRN